LALRGESKRGNATCQGGMKRCRFGLTAGKKRGRGNVQNEGRKKGWVRKGGILTHNKNNKKKHKKNKKNPQQTTKQKPKTTQRTKKKKKPNPEKTPKANGGGSYSLRKVRKKN